MCFEDRLFDLIGCGNTGFLSLAGSGHWNGATTPEWQSALCAEIRAGGRIRACRR
jgi:hypothetical protein